MNEGFYAQDGRAVERQTEVEQLQLQLAESQSRIHDLARRSKAMEAAFKSVSERFELANPGAWSSRQANATFQKILHHEYRGEQQERGLEHGIPQYRVRELRRPHRGSPNIRIGIATMPGREEGLKLVLSALSPQADEIMVYLNGMSEVPEGVPTYRNVRYFVGPDYGDRAKFLFIEGFDGYYLTCDDDIAYPPYYVAHVINGIERYGRSAIVGWHGTIFYDSNEDYYDAETRTTHTYFNSLAEDTAVHVLGTGVAGMHSGTLPLTFEDFRAPNTADVWLALRAQAMSVPMVVLTHGKGWASPVDRQAPSIYNAAKGGDSTGVMNVRQIATDAVRSRGDWKIHEPDLVGGYTAISVAIIGRSDPSPWRQWGIPTSNEMIVDALKAYGVDVRSFDMEADASGYLGGFRPDAVIVYMGDPERPDFGEVEGLVERHAGEGRLVIADMSIEGHPGHASMIRDTLTRWDSQYPGKVRLMISSEVAARSMLAFDEVRNLIFPVPKTFQSPNQSVEFDETTGIFVADTAKVGNEFIVGHSPQDWISALRRTVPEARLYAVQWDKSVRGQALDLDEVWPSSGQEFLDRMRTVRLIVAPVPYATYERVPVEAAGMGIPVISREMPQSPLEVLGLSGVRVQTLEELSAVAALLYRDPALWRSYSRSGNLRALSQDMHSVAGDLYVTLCRSLVGRACA